MSNQNTIRKIINLKKVCILAYLVDLAPPDLVEALPSLAVVGRNPFLQISICPKSAVEKL